MPPKVEKDATPSQFVQMGRSDDNDAAVRLSGMNSRSPDHHQHQQRQQSSAMILLPSASNVQGIEFRSFWKAGDYAVSPNNKPPPFQGQLEHARVHPKFLHSNATSHKWAFGAIAELLDNAVDEIHNGATFVKVDRINIMKDNSPALLFLDDGGGMNPESIRKCMSLGYSSKKSKATIGQYGNGFKTSTMRLGADAIVFSRANQASCPTQSVGLLSYTFLRKTGQDDVIVPMIDFDISGNCPEPIVYSSQDDWSSNLKTILEWSPFESKEDLIYQFEDIGSHGTKIIIYNLWLNDEGIYELNFDDDDKDIRLRDEPNRGGSIKLHKKVVEFQCHISYRLRYSLRAYASVLYHRKFTNFEIILRGVPVEQYFIADEFLHKKVIFYRPQLGGTSREVAVEATIGFVKEAPNINVSGFNVYHKNRLIRPFWKVTGDGSSKGNGVVGVLEANFIEPAHDKQDFERSSLYIRLETRLRQMILDYWKDHCTLMGYQPPKYKAQQMPEGGQVRTLSQPVNNCGTNFHTDRGDGMRGCQSVVDLSESSGQDLSLQQTKTQEKATSTELGMAIPVDRLCEENIQLFRRCEDYMKKDAELRKTIEALEKELEEINGKRVQLSLLLQTKRKENCIVLN